MHGSPQWHVYRELPAFPDGAPAAAAVGTAAPGRPRSGARARSRPSSSGGSGAVDGGSAVGSSSGGSLVLPSDDEIGRYAEAGAAAAPPATQQQTASGLSVVSGEEAGAILDWKGEPMKINPGDKIPFKFL